ncbi:HAD family hydrolase [Microbacterium sp. ZW T5_56]|uniref:HAD family hydrolase n=1 Tax=Microbacterium sp. ZW T5_56 TaxID=3378081 RepID=UPI0038519934
MTTPPLTHVLFDADGVIQDLPGAWRDVLLPVLGERSDEFLRRAWKAELPMLAGEGDLHAMMDALLGEFGQFVQAAVLHDAALRAMTQFDDSLRTIAACRVAGIGVHLGSNQDHVSARHMASVLGYDGMFDVSAYSCAIGAAKPDPRFFHIAAERIGVAPAEILFVDDNAQNVAGAQDAGLQATHWSIHHDQDTLAERLRTHGIVLD